MTTLLRISQVEQRMGARKSWVYDGVADGTFPPPLKLGRRFAPFIESEVEAIAAAMAAGASEDERRQLVTKLVEARQRRYLALLGGLAA